VRIRLVREGGLAGISRAAVVDTETLDPHRAKELHRLVEAADLASLPQPSRAPEGRDRFRYFLTVDDGQRSHEARFNEEDAPETLRDLIRAIRRESEAGAAPPGVSTT
jgi:hypothetical protein